MEESEDKDLESRLIEELRWAHSAFSHPGLVNNGFIQRFAAVEAITALLRYAEARVPTLMAEKELPLPIRVLRRQLLDLDLGRVGPILVPSCASAGRPAPDQDVAFVRAAAAVALTILMKSKTTNQKDGAKEIADRLDRAGYVASGSEGAGNPKRVTPNTVKGWRKKCLEGSEGDIETKIYRDLISRTKSPTNLSHDEAREVVGIILTKFLPKAFGHLRRIPPLGTPKK